MDGLTNAPPFAFQRSPATVSAMRLTDPRKRVFLTELAPVPGPPARHYCIAARVLGHPHHHRKRRRRSTWEYSASRL